MPGLKSIDGCLRRMFLVMWLAMLACECRADSPYTGYYSGALYSKVSGTVTISERKIGDVSFTVNTNGVLSQSGGGLSGLVDGVGGILWNEPNNYSFTIGAINGSGVMTATATVPGDNGANVTYRLSAVTNAAIAPVATNFVWRNPQPIGGEYNSVVFGSNVFVAVGNAGALATSTNGFDWTPRTLPQAVDLYDAAWGTNKVWVAVGAAGRVFYSTNSAVTWYSTNVNSSQTISGVAYGNGRFLAVDMSSPGQIFISTNGITWSLQSVSGTSPQFYGIDYTTNGTFIATGVIASTNAAAFRTSTNGTAWGNSTVTFAADTGPLRGGVYNGSRYVVVGDKRVVTFTTSGGSSGSSATSTDPGFNPGSSVAFGAGRVVIGDATSGGIRYSTNSTPSTWTLATGCTAPASAFAYGTNGFVAVGTGGFQTATNGTLWKLQTRSVGDSSPRDISSPSAGAFLISSAPWNGALGTALRFGDDGQLQYNFQGSVESRNSGTTLALHAAAGDAILVGDQGTILTGSSADNYTSWTPRTSPTFADLYSIAMGSGPVYVAVGQDGAILSSTDGQNFSLASSSVTADLFKVINAQNQFLAVGDQGTIATSPDGSTWTVRTSGVTNRLVGAVLFLNQLLVVSDDGVVLRSTNQGVNWSSANLGAPYRVAALAAWDNGTAGEARAAGENGQLFSTTNGTNWSVSVNAPGDFKAVAQGNGRFVAVGDFLRATSDDGLAWKGNLTGTNQTTLNGVAYGQGLFAAVGVGTNGLGYVQTSADGRHWDSRTTPVSANLNGIVFGNGTFVAVGEGGAMLTSSNALTWTDRTVANAQPLQAVSRANSLFLAVGNGYVRTSADGASWSEASLAGSLRSADFGANLWVIVGDGGIIYTSGDAQTWSPQTSGTASNLYTVRYANSRFVAAGDRVFLTSTDGTNWTAQTTTIASALRALTVANGSLMAVGESGAILQAGFLDMQRPVVSSISGNPILNTGATLQLTALVEGTAPFQYQWYFNGVPLTNDARISGATNAILSITSVTTADEGDYYVVVANDFGSQASSTVSVTVRVAPAIVTDPQSLVRSTGTSATFTVDATGTASLAYFWYKNGTLLQSGTNYSGLGSASLVIGSAGSTDAGAYYVVVSNVVGSATSHVATLSVQAPIGMVPDTVFAGGLLKFDTASAPNIQALALQSDGKLLVGGAFRLTNSLNAVLTNLVRLNTNGTLDETFVPANLNAAVTGLRALTNGQVLVGGLFTSTRGQSNAALTRLTATGSWDSSYQPKVVTPFPEAVCFTRRSDEKIVVGGLFTSLFTNACDGVALLDSRGVLDTNFNTATLSTDDSVYSVAVQTNNSVIVGGIFGSPKVELMRLASDGSLDVNFNLGGSSVNDVPPMTPSEVDVVMVASDNRIYVGGWWATINGTPKHSLARFTAAGALDNTFAPVILTNDLDSCTVMTMLEFNGRILVGGTLTNVNGTTIGRLGMLNTSGSLDTTNLSLGSGFNGPVQCLLRDSLGGIIVGGAFSQLNGVSAPRLARLTTSSGLALAFVTQPADQTVALGGTATFTVAVTGSSPLSFQWRKGTTPIESATNVTFTIPSVSGSDSGTYNVIVTDAYGNLSSQDATLTVSGAVTFAKWISEQGLGDGVQGLADDPDEDGFANIVEYAFGTLPGDAKSEPGLKAVLVTDSNVKYAGVQFTRLKDVSDATIEVDASTNVLFTVPVSLVVVSITDLGDGTEKVIVRTTTALTSTSTFFFRASVVYSP